MYDGIFRDVLSVKIQAHNSVITFGNTYLADVGLIEEHIFHGLSVTPHFEWHDIPHSFPITLLFFYIIWFPGGQDS
jgi:hypothetical protein